MLLLVDLVCNRQADYDTGESVAIILLIQLNILTLHVLLLYWHSSLVADCWLLLLQQDGPSLKSVLPKDVPVSWLLINPLRTEFHVNNI
jgi:hypothetical protein